MAGNSRTKINQAPAATAWNQSVYSALKMLFHVIAAVQFWYAIYYDLMYVHIPPQFLKTKSLFGGKFKYLTFLDTIVQAIYFSTCTVNDFIGTDEIAPKKISKIRQFKDKLLASLAFPLSFNVGISFWSLMAIDRELVFPKFLDPYFPSWLNHVMHTNIMVFIIIEMIISFRKYPKRKEGLTILLTFLLCYLVWLHIIKEVSGAWVYPVLEVLDLQQRMVFFVGILIFTIIIYIAGELINSKIWGRELKIALRKAQ